MSESPDYARTEREAFCELVTAVGPDEPTLCAGWSTRDLAAHLVVRERRPDAALGIVLPPLAAHGEKVRGRVAQRPFAELVEQVRTPPRWTFSGIGPLDRAVNTGEFFIHHEDVRRAQPEWQPRPLDPELGRQLWSRLPMMARMSLRRFPGRVTLAADGYGETSVGTGATSVRVAGDPGELTLFVSGRQRATKVEVTGDANLATQIQQQGFGH